MTRAESDASDLFTAEYRGGAPSDAARRWEEVFGHEESAAYSALLGLARVPLLRRLLGTVPSLREAASLDERERAVAELRANPVYRRLERLRGGRVRGRVPGGSGAAQDLGLPPITSRRVDEAIELLRTVPFQEIQRRGWHLQPNHYYWPLNDLGFLADNRDLWGRRSPKGIAWNLDRQLELVREAAAYGEELADVPHSPRPGRTEFVWGNGTFDGADAVVYYGLIRSRKPRRVIEVGAGWSTLLLARGVEANSESCDVTVIEPGADFNEHWAPTLPSTWRVQEALLQHVDPAWFDELEAGDICFFDGSHCVRTAGDVNWFVFELMPRLQPGVLVHFHDVFFPDDYPERWIFEEGLSWNEQYLLHALLMHSDGYDVLAANHLLYVERGADIGRIHGQDGSSLWLEKRAPAVR